MTFVQRTINWQSDRLFLSMPSLGVSSLDFDRVVQAMRSFFKPKRFALLFRGQRKSVEMMLGQRHQIRGETRKIVGQRIEPR